MSESFDFEGRVALVTGANRGIGRSIALGLKESGADVIGTATTTEGAIEIVEMLGASNVDLGLVMNLNDRAKFGEVWATAEQYKGFPTILVNNAGFNRDELAIKMSEEEWSDVVNANLIGTGWFTMSGLRGLLKTRRADVVTMGSYVGSEGEAGQVNYAAAKAGLEGMTKTLAKEYGHKGLRFSMVNPGYVDTDMTRKLPPERIAAMLQQIPLGRALQPEEIALEVLKVIADQDPKTNGQIVHVNGGLTADSVGPLGITTQS